jgi:hypothetical protein
MQSVSIFIVIVGVFLCQSCGQAYDRRFYERISGIEIPHNASLIETFDNGEFVTVTSFKMSPTDISEIQKKYKFEAVDGSYVPGFLGNSFLKGPKPSNSDLNKCLMKIEQKGKTMSVYVLDTSKHILWAEINYPDWAGN